MAANQVESIVPFMFCRRLVYGPNEILVKESTIPKLLFLEVLNPFYVFQLFSFVLWFVDNYYYYAAAILMMSAFGITMTVVQTRKVRQTYFIVFEEISAIYNCRVVKIQPRLRL